MRFSCAVNHQHLTTIQSTQNEHLVGSFVLSVCLLPEFNWDVLPVFPVLKELIANDNIGQFYQKMTAGLYC